MFVLYESKCFVQREKKMGSCSSLEKIDSKNCDGVQPEAVAVANTLERTPDDENIDGRHLPPWGRATSPQVDSSSTEGSLPIASTCVDHSPNRILSPMERVDLLSHLCGHPELVRLPSLTNEAESQKPNCEPKAPLMTSRNISASHEDTDSDDEDHDRRRRGLLFTAPDSTTSTADDGFCSFEPAVRLNEETTPQGIGLEQQCGGAHHNHRTDDGDFGTNEMLQFRPVLDHSAPKIGISFRSATPLASDDPRRRTMSFADDMMRKPSRSQATVSFSQMVIIVKDDGSSSPSSSERQPSLPSVISDASVTAEFVQTPISSSGPYKAQVAKRQRHIPQQQRQQFEANSDEWEWGQLEAESNASAPPSNLVKDCDDWD